MKKRIKIQKKSLHLLLFNTLFCYYSFMKNIMPILPSSCKSLLCKYLNEDIFEKLKDKKTSHNFTLSNAINSGVQNLDSGIGIYAGDEESYSLFAPLFNPIISDYHHFEADDKHKSNLNIDNLNAPDLDPKNEFILSTRIRVGRNLKDMPLGTAISKEQRYMVEQKVSDALLELQGSLQGKYYHLNSLSTKEQKELTENHFLFKAGDRFLEAAGLNRDWPEGRGIYHNDEKNFLVWVNEEDQLRIISMQKGGDIQAVFSRLVDAIQQIEKSISFSYNTHLGYITSCPTNLGTAMRASVHIKLPKLSSNMELFKNITDNYHLQIRGLHGEHSQSENGIYDISNKRRLGITEVECVQNMYDGVKALIQQEKELN
ncbi:phosphagen kinase [Sulfurospirillum arcachonense]|uniref:phosphagen kinase n=1 Tax=Sulfurospirillum arcachonense TaxID=57666 RepID=UPI001FE23F20|nr:phosphagen kinase [Sulfurospirillum arcachonense]